MQTVLNVKEVSVWNVKLECILIQKGYVQLIVEMATLVLRLYVENVPEDVVSVLLYL